MQIAINIPRGMYNHIVGAVQRGTVNDIDLLAIYLAVTNGKPIEAGHRLNDGDELLTGLIFGGFIDKAKCKDVRELIEKTTLFEADAGTIVD